MEIVAGKSHACNDGKRRQKKGINSRKIHTLSSTFWDGLVSAQSERIHQLGHLFLTPQVLSSARLVVVLRKMNIVRIQEKIISKFFDVVFEINSCLFFLGCA